MTIQDLQAIDLEKVAYPTIKATALELLEDYADEAEENRADFLKDAQEAIDAVYKMIQANSPEALPTNKDEKKVSKNTNEPSKESPKKKKLTKEEMDAYGERIKKCRLEIKEYNAKRREEQPKKPAKKRHEKIEGYLISIGNLVPDNLKDNLDILEASQKILSKTGREIMKVYRMDQLKIKEVQQEIEEKYKKKEEKIKKDNDE
ncbi:hypothetical protein U8527_07140 [Kordia algicida OT-1]|uniref:Uncharacterized protein n=1 Tax=Kordia algicida OT-1 TaxID=391587 RepID=A9E9Z1_9FLAO|nr:hypothetical protein [Kordia algicida]EDP94719.1 hypothetical protein KAOT1_00545 [Kordia algicida OT-1]